MIKVVGVACGLQTIGYRALLPIHRVRRKEAAVGVVSDGAAIFVPVNLRLRQGDAVGDSGEKAQRSASDARITICRAISRTGKCVIPINAMAQIIRPEKLDEVDIERAAGRGFFV